MGPPFPGRLGVRGFGYGFYFALTAGHHNTVLGDPRRAGEDGVQHGLREPAGEGVLLARVEGAEQHRAVGNLEFGEGVRLADD